MSSKSKQRLTIGLYTTESIVKVEAAEGQQKNPLVESYRAKVGHADRPLRNPRVYTAKAWSEDITRKSAEGAFKKGSVSGANGHGGLIDDMAPKRCIVWRSLEMQPDGSIVGEFDVSKEHSDGKNLIAQIGMGMEISFSTVAATSSRPALPADGKQYGIPEAVVDDYWIVEAMDLRRVDAVERPSCFDAQLIEQMEAEMNGERVAGDGGGGHGGTPPKQGASSTAVNTFAELKTAYPKIVEQGVSEAVEAATKPLVTKIQSLIETVVKDVPGLKLPTIVEHREAVDADVQKKVDGLNDRIKALESERDAAVKAKDALEGEKKAADEAKQKLEAEAAKKTAIADAKSKLEAALSKDGKPIRFAEGIKAVVLPSVESGELAADKVEAAVNAKFAEYEKVAGPAVVKPGNPGALGGKSKTDPNLEGDKTTDLDAEGGVVDPGLAKLVEEYRKSKAQ